MCLFCAEGTPSRKDLGISNFDDFLCELVSADLESVHRMGDVLLGDAWT